MALPEHAKSEISPSPSNIEFIAALTEINRQLEIADACENPIERFSKRDSLLEQQYSLETDIASSPPSEIGSLDSTNPLDCRDNDRF